jgi:hypothetical protein
MQLPAAQHPIWALSRVVVFLIFAFCAMYLTAEHFDKTEVECIKWIGFAVLGYEGIQGIVQNFAGKK